MPKPWSTFWWPNCCDKFDKWVVDCPGLSVSALIAIIVVASYPKISVCVALRGMLVRGRRRTS